MDDFGIATGAFVGQRDDWDAAVGRAAAEGWRTLELTAISEELLGSLVGFADRGCDRLAAFARVSVHAPVVVARAVETVAESLLAWDAGYDVVLHPDLYRERQGLRALGPRAVFENMDVAKAFGRTVDDLAEVFERFPEAGFCLDVAHVWTNDRSLALGHELLDAFGGRLRQLHVSGIEPDGTHRLTTAADLDLYRPLLDRCRGVPWLLEAELAGY